MWTNLQVQMTFAFKQRSSTLARPLTNLFSTIYNFFEYHSNWKNSYLLCPIQSHGKHNWLTAILLGFYKLNNKQYGFRGFVLLVICWLPTFNLLWKYHFQNITSITYEISYTNSSKIEKRDRYFTGSFIAVWNEFKSSWKQWELTTSKGKSTPTVTISVPVGLNINI